VTPAFMWRLANDDEVAHYVLFGTFVVERRWLVGEQRVIVVAFPTPQDAYRAVMRGTENFEQKQGLKLTVMYALENPDLVGLSGPIRNLLHAYAAADDRLNDLTVHVLTVFTVAGEVLYV